MTQVDIYRVKNSCMYIVALPTKKIGFHTTGNLTSLSAFGSILKIFGNRCRLMRGSYFWLRNNTTGKYLDSYVELRTL
jgi:hypothetical protein